MNIGVKRVLVLAVLAVGVGFLHIEMQAKTDVLWLDFDMKDIPEPKERTANFYDNFFHEQLFEEAKQDIDIPRWFRYMVGSPKQSMNVNAVDEVPDSSWYTNRHALRPMTIEALLRGPNHSSGPDFDQATITRAKNTGVTPGMQLRDKKGDIYLVKFDRVEWPELQSAAEVITTKILYAAGYNVPENYIAYLKPDQLLIGSEVEPFTREDLERMLEPIAKLPDGRIRVLASKMLPGKPKGPFPHIGVRGDDPNDLIPHEHRRELRGLRVIASWLNHWDMKEEQSLDVYVEENGRRFLRHYLLDFGSSLGGGQNPLESFRGHQHVFDAGDIVHELITLGIHESYDEKKEVAISPQVGLFSSRDFDPENWKTTYPVMAFQNMTDEDAFWGVRVMLSFTEGELRKIVETAQYSDPKNTEYVLQTLLERRRMVAGHWLRQVNPIARFSIEKNTDGVALKFRDFVVENNLANASLTEYVYQVKAEGFESEAKATRQRIIQLDRKVLGGALENVTSNRPIEVTIRTKRPSTDRDPVTVYLFPRPNGEFVVGRVSRG
jgi:hypothetical protein